MKNCVARVRGFLNEKDRNWKDGWSLELRARLSKECDALIALPSWRGWRLIDAGLRSPVVSNRNIAIGALGAWGKDSWPTEAEDALRLALNQEPEDNVRERIRKVLAGESLQE